jgi:hypothetical protein
MRLDIFRGNALMIVLPFVRVELLVGGSLVFVNLRWDSSEDLRMAIQTEESRFLSDRSRTGWPTSRKNLLDEQHWRGCFGALAQQSEALAIEILATLRFN